MGDDPNGNGHTSKVENAAPNPGGITSKITFRSNASCTTKPKRFFRIKVEEQ